jgi:hypothetical protein
LFEQTHSPPIYVAVALGRLRISVALIIVSLWCSLLIRYVRLYNLPPSLIWLLETSEPSNLALFALVAVIQAAVVARASISRTVALPKHHHPLPKRHTYKTSTWEPVWNSAMLTASSFPSPLSRRLRSSRSLPYLRLTTLPTSRRGPAKRKISTCSPPQSVPDGSTTSKVSYARYEPMQTIEPFERYAAGGYYPVRIGDQFCSSRYYIVHKLGHGASFTIWLARDEHLAK